jgi:high-affinity K+ transport system ATPase subunit B
MQSFLRTAGIAARVQRERASLPSRTLRRSLSSSVERVRIIFVEDGEDIPVEAEVGKTLLEAAHSNDIDLEGEHAPVIP